MKVRKNLMIDDSTLKKLEVLENIEKGKDRTISLSQIVNKSIEYYLEEQLKNNLAFKLRLFTEPVSEDEEEEILAELSKLSKEDLEIDEDSTIVIEDKSLKSNSPIKQTRVIRSINRGRNKKAMQIKKDTEILKNK